MKRILIALLIMFSVTASYAQTEKPFSKKETKEFVAQLKELLSVGDYETAIKTYQSSASRVVVKNIAKADREWWETTIAELDNKEQLFNSSQAAVSEAKRLYSTQEYWKCNEALNNMSLNRDCARLETLRQYNDLSGKLKAKLPTLQMVDSKMPEVVELYNRKDVEQLFIVFFNGVVREVEETGGDIKSYVDIKYLPIVKAIFDEYGSLYDKYYDTYAETVYEPQNKINSLRRIKEMGHNEAKDCLAFFESLEKKIKKVTDFPAQEYPILAGHHTFLLDYASKSIEAANKRIKETNPIDAIFKGGNVTLNQIKGDCSKVDSKLKSILSADVLEYYNKGFSTDLQRDLYKDSDEYKQRSAELQHLKKQALNTVYYSSIQDNIGSYSVENAGFFIEIGSNKGVHHLFGNWDVEVHHPNEIEGVVHESLSVASFTNKLVSLAYRNGDKSYIYKVLVPVPKNIAAQIENKDCELVICFIPAGVKTYRCMGAEFNGDRAYDVFYADTTCPYSKKVRMFLFSKNGELLFDKVL